MFPTDPAKSWTSPQKIIFRFVFLCLGFFLLDYEIAMLFLNLNLLTTLGAMYSAMAQPLYWLDSHIYHLGFDPKSQAKFPGDTHFGMVYFLTAMIIFTFVVIIWSFLDRHKKNYYKLNYWFRLYIRYVVALIVFTYGIEKVFQVQMVYPQVTDLLTPLGDSSRFAFVWSFIGASPAYEMFTGICEVIASLLLIFNRTYVFGSLVMCTVLSNVVALNFFYNIPVKLFSSLLLVSVLYVLAPYIQKLAEFFFYGKPVSLSEKHYKFEKGWKKYVVAGLGICIPLFSFVNSSFRSGSRHHRIQAEAKDQRLYDVAYFVTKDTLPPLVTDTLRWKRFALLSTKLAAVYNMDDKADFYDCDIDSLKHTCRLHDNDDSTKWDIFHYSYDQKNMLQFTGFWKGTNVSIFLKQIPIDSMTLNKERIKFLQD